jgi:cytochrome c peroxidase
MFLKGLRLKYSRAVMGLGLLYGFIDSGCGGTFPNQASLPETDSVFSVQAATLLGKKLFFDPVLSGNNKVSCASCHRPELAFSDGQALSKQGVSGKPLGRHVPSLVNLAYQSSFFWDGGVKNLESLPLAPPRHPDEMGQNLSLLLAELRQDRHYPDLFKKVFGTDSLTLRQVLMALSYYQQSLKSFQSPYDESLLEIRTLSNPEQRGLHIFTRHCASCHTPPLFTDQRFYNNGLDNDFSDTTQQGIRQGRYRITYAASDLGCFKTPSLRNVALTAPYMHDGRFATLEEVLSHYSQHVKNSPSLSPLIPKNGFGLNLQEQADLLSFLHTLTDAKSLQTGFAP